MDTKNFYDFHKYLSGLVAKNKLAQSHGFAFCSCSGIGYLEELLRKMHEANHFVCLSDVSEESITKVGGAWFKRRVFTVFLLSRYDVRRFGDYREALTLCRELFRQLHSRFIVDEAALQSELVYLNVADIRNRELGGEFLNGSTGLYFMVALDEPTDLTFRKDEWDE